MIRTANAATPNQSNAVYDAAGMRAATLIDGVWTVNLYDIAGNQIAEMCSLQSNTSGGVKYHIQDWQGSTRLILEQNGTVEQRTDYTAYGEEIVGNIGMRTQGQGYGQVTNTNQYALTTDDKATGLNHTRFRKLENKAGRWTSPDPYNGSAMLTSSSSFNRYSYVEGQPHNFVDPSGLFINAPGKKKKTPDIGIFFVTVRATYDDWDDYFGAEHSGGGALFNSTVAGIEALMLGGGGDGTELDCPKPNNTLTLPFTAAVSHYLHGNGEPLTIPLAEVQALPPQPFDFPGILDAYNSGSGVYELGNKHSLAFRATGWQREIIGRLTWVFNGILTVKDDGNFSVIGEISMLEASYDFDIVDGRDAPDEFATRIGSLLPGTPYKIYADGKFKVTYSSNADGTISSSCSR